MLKPLGRKAYGSIGHLPDSRLGPGDHKVNDGQARICTHRARDKHDTVYVQEKLDGSCTAVARVGDEIVALGRRGYPATTSPFEQHQLFASWVRERNEIFSTLLNPGERLVGEWLAQAHGTVYELAHEPWVPFDLMVEAERFPLEELTARVDGVFKLPYLISKGEPFSVDEALSDLGEYGRHGAVDRVEGLVYRVERKGKVDYLAKFVRPEKVDGSYLPEIAGCEPVWNWHPSATR